MEAIKYSAASYWWPRMHDSTVAETVVIKLKAFCTLGEEEEVNSHEYRCKLKQRSRWERKCASRGDTGDLSSEDPWGFFTCKDKISLYGYSIKSGGSCVFFGEKPHQKQQNKKSDRAKPTPNWLCVEFKRGYFYLIWFFYIINNRGGWDSAH